MYIETEIEREETLKLLLDSITDYGEEKATINLISDDNVLLSSVIIKKSNTFNSGLLSALIDNNINENTFPINYGQEYEFKKCMEYLDHHENKPIELPTKPLKSSDLIRVWKDEWDVNFIENIYKDGLSGFKRVVFLSNYMLIDGLVHLCCTKIASVIKNSSLDKIEEIFI